jgi:hypothetical protein
MKLVRNTIAQIVYGPHRGSAATSIPAGTPANRLRELQARYADLGDPAVADLPHWYRAAVTTRLRVLLVPTVAVDQRR